LAKKKAGHVEVVDRHVTEDAAGVGDIVARGQARVAAGDDDLPYFTYFAGIDSTAQLDVARVEAAVEGHHDARLQGLELGYRGIGLCQVVVHRLLAQHCLAGVCGQEHEVGVGVGRGPDDHRIDV